MAVSVTSLGRVSFGGDELGYGEDVQASPMPWSWREAHLRDPDGHHLCFYHAGGRRAGG
jgi:hypothetical protein